ncbi:MAG: hypothetical protein IAI48_16835 [Candidatus Eremiobacteraeota bacterium]|nr:hypothetical protein [Candidatus Eremiobacteraeota bacterium]
MIARLGLLMSARRFDRVLAISTNSAIIVLVLAYAAKLNESHANVAKDVQLTGYVQVAGARAIATRNTTFDYANLLLNGTVRDASASWHVTPTEAFAEQPGHASYVFVIGPSLSFSRRDGTASVTLDGRRLGIIRADAPGAATTIAIPPSTNTGWRFPLPTNARCTPGCTITLGIDGGAWDVQRLGIADEVDSRVGAALWIEPPATIATIVLCALLACYASYRIVRATIRGIAPI